MGTTTAQAISDPGTNFKELLQYQYASLASQRNASAIDFLPILRQFSLGERQEIENFLQNPVAKQVLIHDEFLKVVMIRWAPYEECNLHGHASRGCAFKVLHGAVEEKRYSTDHREELLSKSTYYTGHIAYIDDMMGLHTVRNPRPEPAITLHMYTPGM